MPDAVSGETSGNYKPHDHGLQPENLLQDHHSNSGREGLQLSCPGTFDGWSCWPETPAGTTAFAPCPDFITGFDPNKFANRNTETIVYFSPPSSSRLDQSLSYCVMWHELKTLLRVRVLNYTVFFVIFVISILRTM
ncbi:hypothetical protein L9F63_007263, partial [Diploptera punctata]